MAANTVIAPNRIPAAAGLGDLRQRTEWDLQRRCSLTYRMYEFMDRFLDRYGYTTERLRRMLTSERGRADPPVRDLTTPRWLSSLGARS